VWDRKAKKQAIKAVGTGSRKKKTVGSEFYNNLAGIFGSKIMKLGSGIQVGKYVADDMRMKKCYDCIVQKWA